MTAQLRAVIFDVDGTLADTERDGHRPAFNEAFARHGLGFTWGPEEYGELLAITGGRRRVAHDLRRRGHPAEVGDIDDLAAAVHRTKTALFRDRVSGGAVSARPGVPELVGELRRGGVRIAVATTGRRAWVEPLVARLLGEDAVEVMVTGDEVDRLKPDPEAYLAALAKLRLAADEALAVEDSSVGLRAATGAGLATVVVVNDYTRGQDFAGAAEVREGYGGRHPFTAARCHEVHAAWWAGSG